MQDLFKMTRISRYFALRKKVLINQCTDNKRICSVRFLSLMFKQIKQFFEKGSKSFQQVLKQLEILPKILRTVF